MERLVHFDLARKRVQTAISRHWFAAGNSGSFQILESSWPFQLQNSCKRNYLKRKVTRFTSNLKLLSACIVIVAGGARRCVCRNWCTPILPRTLANVHQLTGLHRAHCLLCGYVKVAASGSFHRRHECRSDVPRRFVAVTV